jgi:hypothetical protein
VTRRALDRRCYNARVPADRAPRPLELVLYTRAGCGLCAEVAEEIGRARLGARATLELVDVDANASLRELYGSVVPVLAIDGRVALHGRIEPAELHAELARALRSRAERA